MLLEGLIREGLAEAFRLVVGLDQAVFDAALRTLWISTTSVLIAVLIGLPLGSFLARRRLPGKGAVVLLLRASMAIPTVFVGILCYSLFSRRGPLGPIELLYTPWAVIAGELLLALPIIASLSHGSIAGLDPRVAETARTLGATPLRRWCAYVSEARTGIVLGVLTAFARCSTELGIAMMVGGNILGRTRTLATATALETSKGEYARGLAMGILLLSMSLGVTALIMVVGREREPA